jgi:hypothetical protein
MSTPKQLPFTQWADVHGNPRFISVEPLSGYRIIQREDEGYVLYLEPNASNEALGRALLDALARSRYIFPPDRAFSKAERYMQCYYNWQKDFMQRYGYKTKRDAYRNMDGCRAKRSEGKIAIQPHKRDKTEYFNNLPPEDTVIIPATNDVEAVGAALRLALSRCG